ncbi:type II toxin-antitoxin system prevent-host-death family antitoxin [Erwinia piriflorinigrans]|uniref:Prevent-host-death family protein n=1 Tax=Erwinia piriflorinigrans CFBP 5888 TaxID=1161919 RepID=V5Z5X5_9GAMM|nr:type II toxin-antitoxin system prevent-host-death family antitoxin [Erwinia piriflorinigrans]CCG86327.1 prevent-host-death family protein [Erwinia piriflorinigrans CFBP 5888]
MTSKTYTSRLFNQDVSGAKKAAETAPVYITVRGRPSHVLMTFAQYQKLSGASVSLADALYMPGAGEVDFELSREDLIVRDVDF